MTSKKIEGYQINGYLPTIGIECHVQLKTKTKLFAGVQNDARNAKPNSLISHICLGMPGALPVLNQQAVELAARAAFALGTRPSRYSKFDRKHYFYPDLPKGYQITQFDQPIIIGGYVDIRVNDNERRIGIARAHLEEDAGKSTHPEGKDYSLVDLNRAGTPLLELVSEPDIHSASEAKAYARELYLLMRYAEVSEGDLFHGNMRFDVNVSVSKSGSLGVRTETKNLNSFKSVEKSVEYEILRQIRVLESGGSVVQETRGWDDAKQKTFSQRSKEEAHDYRYFPEPDIPPVVLESELVKEIEDSMPTMPGTIRRRLQEFGLDSSVTETLIDQMPAGKFILEAMKNASPAVIKRIANWLATDIQSLVIAGELSWEQAKLDIEGFIGLDQLVSTNQISSTSAKAVLAVMVKAGGDPLVIAKQQDILQVSDKTAIQAIVEKVLDDNPQAAEDVRAGELKAIGFLVGQVMKQSKGKANPSLAKQVIKDILGVV